MPDRPSSHQVAHILPDRPILAQIAPDCHSSPQLSTHRPGALWRPLAPPGALCRSLALSGALWRPLAPSGALWRSLVCSGALWRSPALSGALRRPLAPSGALWCSLALSGALWRPLAPSGLKPLGHTRARRPKKSSFPCRRNAYHFCGAENLKARWPTEPMLPSTQNGNFLQNICSRLRRTHLCKSSPPPGAALWPGFWVACGMSGSAPWPALATHLRNIASRLRKTTTFQKKSLLVYAKAYFCGLAGQARARTRKKNINISKQIATFVCSGNRR